MIVTNIRGLGAAPYVPDCSAAYNPCNEMMKAQAIGKSAAMVAAFQKKCDMFTTACGRGGDATAVQASVERAAGRAAGPIMFSPDSMFATHADAVPALLKAVTPADPADMAASTNFDVMQWLSDNKGTVGVGLALVVGAAVLWKLL